MRCLLAGMTSFPASAPPLPGERSGGGGRGQIGEGRLGEQRGGVSRGDNHPNWHPDQTFSVFWPFAFTLTPLIVKKNICKSCKEDKWDPEVSKEPGEHGSTPEGADPWNI